MTDTRHGFTLIELILAITICGGMLVGALHLHHEAERVRQAATARMEIIGAARLLMDRITVELLGASDTSPYEIRLEGYRDRIEFHTTDDGGGLVGYRTRKETPEVDPDDEERHERGRSSVVVGIERTRTHAANVAIKSDDANVDARADDDANGPLLVSNRLRYLRFRYHDGKRWHDSWRREALPRGVEVTVGVEPLERGRRYNAYDGEIFRRVVSIPDATTRGWHSNEKRQSEGVR